MAISETEFQVGCRCICEGFCGTIRYVGEVPPSKGLWLGVEWDDTSRGKHSGEHGGVQYFTSSKPCSSSFVRPKKISLGCTFVEALQKRYGGGSAEGQEEEEENEMYLVSKGLHMTPVEMVGTEKLTKKQSQYDKLHHVSLREMAVSSAGREREIETIAPNIVDLNLSNNPLLPGWEVVAVICSQLKKLRTLQLSENKSLSLPVDPASLTPAFSSLKAVFLNKMDLPWSKVCVILKMMPNLEELHICENRIENLRPPEGGQNPLPIGLQLLNLEENQLSDWSEILQLQQLPRLKTLILNDNQISRIFWDQQGTQFASCFPALESLSLNRNLINTWSSIDAVGRLPALLELKFKGNPLLSDEPTFTARQLLIARIRQLTSTNSSGVTDRERQLAERYYLKRYALEWVGAQANEGSKRDFASQHPRYAHLAEVHGLPEEALQTKKAFVTALKNRLISVTIRCPDHPNQRQLTKKLPETMTVQKLKGLLQRMYRVDSSDQRLSYVDQKGEHEVEMSDDLKQLSFYSIETGDTILMRW